MDSKTLADIQSHAGLLLRDCGVRRPPTPLDPLLLEKQLELFPFDAPTEIALPQSLKDSVRAFIHVPDKEIYISKQIHRKQQRFASFHEIGHYVLPWHKKLFYDCSETDLSPSARRLFDMEANAFAAECIFQGSAFTEQALDSRFAMRSVMTLADRYSVSFESAGRRYVERHPDACAFVVCEPTGEGEDPNESGFKLKYAVRSASFPSWFQSGSMLSADHVISQICRKTHDAPVREKIILSGTASTTLKCNAHIFFNGYKALILLKPRKFKGPGHDTPLI